MADEDYPDVPQTGPTGPGDSLYWGGEDDWPEDESSQYYNPRLVLYNQCQAMIRYGAKLGLKLPMSALETVEKVFKELRLPPTAESAVSLSELADAHGRLAAVVAPATPSTIKLLADERTKGIGRYFGPTKYARTLSYISIGAFLVFVAGQIWVANRPNVAWLDVAVTVLASIIGGLFFVMFALSQKLKAGSFDSRLEGEYTTLVILGAIAGTLLALVVVQPQALSNAADTSTFNICSPARCSRCSVGSPPARCTGYSSAW